MSGAVVILHGKHKGESLELVVMHDPNYALWAYAECGWFPKLSDEQIKDCQSRYKQKLKNVWFTFDCGPDSFADYGDGWC